MSTIIRPDKVGKECQIAGEKWNVCPELGGREVGVELGLIIFIQSNHF